MLVPLASAVSVNEQGIIISSPKETYFCEAVISDNGCLVKTTTEITNNRAGNINALLMFDANRDITIRDYKNQGQQIALEASQGKNLNSLNRILIASGETKTIEVDFYASESGKYNYSIEFSGITVKLDPFFNITYNTSSPTQHLIHGKVNEDNDSSFSSQFNITNQLYDNLDSTNFNVYRNFTGAITTEFDSHDNIGDSNTADVNVNGEGFFTNISYSISNPIQSMEFCFLSNTVSGSPLPNISIAYNVTTGENPIRLNGFTTTIGTDTWQCDSIDSKYFPRFENKNSVVIGLVCDNCDGGNKFKIRRDDGGTAGIFNVDDSATPTWNEDLTRSLMINLTITEQAAELDGKALRTTFPISFNTNNNYWLNVRKITLGIANATVHLYNEGLDSIQSLLISKYITTGNDIIPLPITQNITASLRLYTTESSNISESFLIEQIEDTVFPIVNTKQINNTALVCNTSNNIRLSSNVTDDNFIDTVFFEYYDNLGRHYEEADRIIDTDIFFIDKVYSQDTASIETYNFTLVNATDLASQSTLDSSIDSFTYSCIPPDNTPPIMLINDFTNNSIVDSRFNQTINFTVSDDIEIKNVTWYATNDTIPLIIRNFFPNSTSFDVVEVIDTSPFAPGVYDIHRIAYDTSNNSVSDFTRLNFVDFDTFVNLVSPSNNTQTDITWQYVKEGTINFDFNLGTSSSCSLLINDTLVETSAFNPGLNSFAYDAVNDEVVSWKISCIEDVTFLQLNSSFRIHTIQFNEVKEAFSLGECPLSSITNTAMFMFFFIILFGIMIFAFMTKQGIVGSLGALGFLIMSLYLYSCLQLIAAFMTGISILLWFFFILNGKNRFANF